MPGPTTASGTAPGSAATDRVRGSLLAVAMIGAPVLITAGFFLAAGNGTKSKPSAQVVADFVAHRNQHIIAGMIAATGFVLLIPAVTGLIQFARSRGAALATVGGVLAGIGAAGLAVNIYLISVVMGVLTTHSHDYGVAASVDHIGRHSTLGAAGFMVGLGFSVGVVLIGIALLRAGTVSRWLVGLLILGAVLVAAPTGPWFGLPISVAFILLGVLRWQAVHSAASVSVPAAAGEPAAPGLPSLPAQQSPASTPTTGANAG